MSKHTKEPWRLGRFTGPASYEEVREMCGAMDVVADTDNGPYVLAGCNINFPDDARANASRIVACVNACAGISDEALESWMNPPDGGFGHPHGPWPAHIISLQRATEIVAQQRDDLMAAIRLTLDENGHLADGDVCTLKRLKDALAKVGADSAAIEGHNVKVTGSAPTDLQEGDKA